MIVHIVQYLSHPFVRWPLAFVFALGVIYSIRMMQATQEVSSRKDPRIITKFGIWLAGMAFGIFFLTAVFA